MQKEKLVHLDREGYQALLVLLWYNLLPDQMARVLIQFRTLSERFAPRILKDLLDISGRSEDLLENLVQLVKQVHLVIGDQRVYVARQERWA